MGVILRVTGSKILIIIESGTFNLPTQSAILRMLEQLPMYFYLITGRIQLDYFDRSVNSQCALCNKTWLKFRKAFCLF